MAVDSTYLHRYDIDTEDTVIHMAGRYSASYGNYAHWRAHALVGWKLGNWDASWTTRWIGKMQVGSGDPTQYMSADGVFKGVVLDYGSYMYHNLQVGYDMAGQPAPGWTTPREHLRHARPLLLAAPASAPCGAGPLQRRSRAER
ncbi:hypothetical protein NB693_20450 [Pantoea ananatis]|uniref:hypothetical protein n=1 Tax=Pantoea ananas TaxID=553 RepID=UPI0022205A8D|nr:hypothetical protein [Pantoea ananatis]